MADTLRLRGVDVESRQFRKRAASLHLSAANPLMARSVLAGRPAAEAKLRSTTEAGTGAPFVAQPAPLPSPTGSDGSVRASPRTPVPLDAAHSALGGSRGRGLLVSELNRGSDEQTDSGEGAFPAAQGKRSALEKLLLGGSATVEDAPMSPEASRALSEARRQWQTRQTRMDWVMLIGLFYSFIVVPGDIAFWVNGPPINPVLIGCFGALYATDLVINVMAARACVPHSLPQHFRYWFWWDAAALLPLPIEIVRRIGGFDHWAQTFKLLGMLKLARVFRKGNAVVDAFQTGTRRVGLLWTNFLTVGMLLMLVVLFSHWIACLWYAVSDTQGVGEDGSLPWTMVKRIHRTGETVHSTDSDWDRYSTTALSVLLLLMGEPMEFQTEAERFTAFLLLIVGTFLTATVLGQTTVYMQSMIAPASRRFNEKREKVRAMINRLGLPDDLHERIDSYFEYMYECHQLMDSKEERDFLSELPTSLQVEITIVRSKTIIDNCWIFDNASLTFALGIVTALQREIYLPEDIVVLAGDVNRDVYFLAKGEVAVLDDAGEQVTVLGLGSYFGEMALLLGLPRTATVKAVTWCEVELLEEEVFAALLEKHPDQAQSMRAIAEQRVQELARGGRSHTASVAVGDVESDVLGVDPTWGAGLSDSDPIYKLDEGTEDVMVARHGTAIGDDADSRDGGNPAAAADSPPSADTGDVSERRASEQRWKKVKRASMSNAQRLVDTVADAVLDDSFIKSMKIISTTTSPRASRKDASRSADSRAHSVGADKAAAGADKAAASAAATRASSPRLSSRAERRSARSLASQSASPDSFHLSAARSLSPRPRPASTSVPPRMSELSVRSANSSSGRSASVGSGGELHIEDRIPASRLTEAANTESPDHAAFVAAVGSMQRHISTRSAPGSAPLDAMPLPDDASTASSRSGGDFAGFDDSGVAGLTHSVRQLAETVDSMAQSLRRELAEQRSSIEQLTAVVRDMAEMDATDAADDAAEEEEVQRRGSALVVAAARSLGVDLPPVLRSWASDLGDMRLTGADISGGKAQQTRPTSPGNSSPGGGSGGGATATPGSPYVGMARTRSGESVTSPPGGPVRWTRDVTMDAVAVAKRHGRELRERMAAARRAHAARGSGETMKLAAAAALVQDDMSSQSSHGRRRGSTGTAGSGSSSGRPKGSQGSHPRSAARQRYARAMARVTALQRLNASSRALTSAPAVRSALIRQPSSNRTRSTDADS